MTTMTPTQQTESVNRPVRTTTATNECVCACVRVQARPGAQRRSRQNSTALPSVGRTQSLCAECAV